MKGIILAGGSGTRLHPLTKVTNKHLLPVGRKPMILHSIEKLTDSNISDIMVVGTEHMGDMINLLGSGKRYNCSLTYRVQEESAGIADALRLAKNFTGEDSFIVLLGDNMFEDHLSPHIERYTNSNKSCLLLLKKVHDPERYGVAVIKNKKIISAIEKPKEFISDLCITGIYMYDKSVYEKIEKLKPSSRGEYEITELNHQYIVEQNADHSILTGWWTDAGTFDSYGKANILLNGIK